MREPESENPRMGYMQQFLETVSVLDGVPQHLAWHRRRVEATYKMHFNELKPFEVEETLSGHDRPATGRIKCTILYGTEVASVTWSQYQVKTVRKLKRVEIPAGYDYRYKYADRRFIEELYASKGDSDDILMTRGGWITDTSIANIAFRKKDRWYTPAQPLLAGTTWKRLITEGRLIPRPIHQSEFDSFDEFKVFNALIEF